MTAGSFGVRASKTSVTRGRPPTMSAEPATSLGWRASIWPILIFWPSCTSMRAFAGRWWKSRIWPSSSSMMICGCFSPVCSMTMSSMPALACSSRTVSPISMSLNRTTPDFSARIGVRWGSHSTRIWPFLTLPPFGTLMTAP